MRLGGRLEPSSKREVSGDGPDARDGAARPQRIFALTVKAARRARAFTTTTERLAEKYRAAGVERMEVIGNYLGTELTRPRNRHDGLVIGWVGGVDHRPDAARIAIADALARVVAKHRDVRVECMIGSYAGLGEEQGGQSVTDDGWFGALDRLVSHSRQRRRLAKRAKRWAKGQTIEAVADRWEQVFATAAGTQ